MFACVLACSLCVWLCKLSKTICVFCVPVRAVVIAVLVLLVVLVLGCCVVGALFANVSVTSCVMSCMTSGVTGVRSKLCLLSAWTRADIFYQRFQ